MTIPNANEIDYSVVNRNVVRPRRIEEYGTSLTPITTCQSTRKSGLSLSRYISTKAHIQERSVQPVALLQINDYCYKHAINRAHIQ